MPPNTDGCVVDVGAPKIEGLLAGVLNTDGVVVVVEPNTL